MTSVVNDTYTVGQGLTLQDGPTTPMPPLSVSIAPPSIFSFPPSCPVTSVVATANPVGGVAPYTFLWTRESGSIHTINSPNNQSTTFTHNNIPGGGAGIYRCTVTDSLNDTVFADMTVDLECGSPP